MTDIQFIEQDTKILFHKKLWHESEIVLAKCFNFIVDMDASTITATICQTSKKAMFEFIKIAFRTFNEALHETDRRNAFYARLEEIYSYYTSQALSVAQQKLPYYNQFFQHQKDATAEAFYKKHNFYAFEMGLGKTITSASISRIHGISRTVIACPAAVKWNWYDDLKKFGFNELYFTVLDSAKRRTFYAFQEGFVIVNYDIIDDYMDYICQNTVGGMVGHFIFDEAQKLKNHLSGRSKKVAKMLATFPEARITFLSGTPISNRVNDVFNYLKMTGHELGHNHAKFLKEFTITASGRGGERVTGGKNLQDLHLKLSNFMIRKTKAECLDLPEKIFINYKYELDDYLGEYNAILAEMSQHKSIATLTGNIHSLNIVTSKAKRKGIIDLAETIIDDGRKVVIFGGYTEPLNQLQEYFGNRCVKIDGSVESFMRNEYVKRFVNDDDCVVFLGNWDAAGVGINLVNASDIIVQNFPLTPDKLWQGIDRLHRIGQKFSVNIHLQFCIESIDEHLWALLQDKESDINAVIDNGKEVVLRENMTEVLIKKLLKRDDIVFENPFHKAASKAQGEAPGKDQVEPLHGSVHGQGVTDNTILERNGPNIVAHVASVYVQPANKISPPAVPFNPEGGIPSAGYPPDNKDPLVGPQYYLRFHKNSNALFILNEEENESFMDDEEGETIIVWNDAREAEVLKIGRHLRLQKGYDFENEFTFTKNGTKLPELTPVEAWPPAPDDGYGLLPPPDFLM